MPARRGYLFGRLNTAADRYAVTNGDTAAMTSLDELNALSVSQDKSIELYRVCDAPDPKSVTARFLRAARSWVSGRTLGVSPAVDTQAIAARARAIIMEVERQLGFEPTDREFEKLGYDIESRVAQTGKLRFIEVKGRVSTADTVTVTRNEILYSLNKPDDFILAIVEFLDAESHRVHYLRSPIQREPDFGVTSVNYDLAGLLTRAQSPS